MGGGDDILGEDLLDLDDLSETTMKLTLPREGRVKRMTVPTIRVVAGPNMLRFASIAPGEELLLGRDENCGLTLLDGSVSRYHVRLHSDSNGQITVQDLESMNGTSINSRATTRGLLRPGDHLEVGAVSLRLDMLGLDELAHLARIQERLNTASSDPLTGLMTRHFMDSELPMLLDRCVRAEVPMSCMFVDADHFKTVNDTYGHGVGDEVLQAIARLLMLQVRDSDPCVRYGGEEFLVFLPGAAETTALEVAERLRRSISGHDWERTVSGLSVTASIGVAEQLPKESTEAFLQRADKAMYFSKNNGRNQVTRASEL